MKPCRPGTVQDKVLRYLLTGHSLDLPKAIAMWGHVRLSDAILKLRKKGHNIITGTLEVPHSDVCFGYYLLVKTPWKGTPEGTRIQVIKGSNKGWYGTVVEVMPRSPLYQLRVLLKSGKTDYIPYDYAEVQYEALH